MRKTTRAILSTIMIGTALTVATYAYAARTIYIQYVYADAQGNIVGGLTYPCGGGQYAWGTTTPYYTRITMPCF